MVGPAIPPWLPASSDGSGPRYAWVRSLDTADGDVEPGTAKFCKATVRHASASGVCLVLSWRPEPRELLSIDFLAAPGQASHPLQARVTHARPSSQAGWVTICAFVPPLEDDKARGAWRVEGEGWRVKGGG